MIGRTLVFLALASLAIASKPFAGVNPNTLACDSTGQEFLLLPSFSDCSKFLMCVHGEEVEFSCAGGLVFDFELQGCNWVSDTECILRGEATEEPKPETVAPEEESSGDWEIDGSGDWELETDSPPASHPIGTVRPPVEIPSVSLGTTLAPEVTSRPGSIPIGSVRPLSESLVDQLTTLRCSSPDLSSRLAEYRGDCQRYWRCRDGVAETVFCADGLYFNSRSLQCDFEANVACASDDTDELGSEFLVY